MAIRWLVIPMLVLVFIASSCSSRTKVGSQPARSSSGRNAPKEDSVAQRKSARQAKEESVFIDACTEKLIGNPGKALLGFREVLEMNPLNAAANYEVAGIYRAQQQPDRALKYAMRADSLHPENDWYKLRHAQLLTDLGRYEQATKLMKQLSERHPKSASWQYEYANALRQSGNHKAALGVYQRIEQLEGPSDTLVVCRIAAYKALNDNAAVLQILEQQIAAEPQTEMHYMALAAEYETQGNAAGVTKTLERRATAFPGSVAAQLELATNYKAAGKQTQAIRQAAVGFAIPQTPDAKVALLRNWYPGGDSLRLSAVQLNEADSLCSILRRVHPDVAGTWAVSATILLQRNKLREAREACRKAIAIDKAPWQPWQQLLDLNNQLGDEEAQLRESKEATELFPQQPMTWYYYGSLLLRRKSYREAIDPLEIGASYVYDDPALELKFKVMIIEAYRETGDEGEVVKRCKRILRNDATNATVIFELCNSYSRQHIELVDAQERLTALVAAHPETAAYSSLLGWVDYQLGEFEQAKNHLQQALKLNAGDALANERMGDVQLALGQKDEAVRYWKIAKAKGSTSPTLDQKISTRGTSPN